MSNVLRFNNGACEKTRLYLDSYISGELMVETNHEVLAHLDICPDCRAEHDLRARLRGAVREAVKRQEVPADLDSRLRSRLQSVQSSRFSAVPRWSLAIAASAVIAVAGAIFFAQKNATPFMPLNLVAQETFIARTSGRLPAMLQAGFADHLHCSVSRLYPSHVPDPKAMKPEQRLEGELAPLAPLVRKLIPEKFALVMAHRCARRDQRFLHLTFRGEGKLVSLVVLKKSVRESFTQENLIPSLKAAGVPVYQRGVDAYQVAGFESAQFLVYLVSDLPDQDNLQLAGALAQPVRDFLDTLKS